MTIKEFLQNSYKQADKSIQRFNQSINVKTVDQELYALDAYLPQSDSSLAEIIRYTEKDGGLD